MDGLTGEVRRIGIRASTVRTFRGADIIVPNADLVTKQVTNWTLGDKLRRIDLPVGVNYGANPEDVIRILVGAANAHPDVIKSPDPVALFRGYGDSSINFELRVWTDKLDRFPKIRSDLATAIYHACPKEGITFPFPQREVHIFKRHDENTTK
jgi:small-conductance mechanosensitive channel